MLGSAARTKRLKCGVKAGQFVGAAGAAIIRCMKLLQP